MSSIRSLSRVPCSSYSIRWESWNLTSFRNHQLIKLIRLSWHSQLFQKWSILGCSNYAEISHVIRYFQLVDLILIGQPCRNVFNRNFEYSQIFSSILCLTYNGAVYAYIAKVKSLLKIVNWKLDIFGVKNYFSACTNHCNSFCKQMVSFRS